MRLLLIAVLTASLGQLGFSQTASVPKPAPLPGDIVTHPNWPTAAPADVDSVDHLVAALYDVISGPAGQQRDWKRFRSLFLPSGRLGPIRPEVAPKDGQPGRAADVSFLTPDMYAERDDPYFKANGFFERGIASRSEHFGNLVHVWTTYESRRAAGDPKPFARGINSIQIVKAAGRYWISSIQWDAEREGLTLPSEYLSTSEP